MFYTLPGLSAITVFIYVTLTGIDDVSPDNTVFTVYFLNEIYKFSEGLDVTLVPRRIAKKQFTSGAKKTQDEKRRAIHPNDWYIPLTLACSLEYTWIVCIIKSEIFRSICYFRLDRFPTNM